MCLIYYNCSLCSQEQEVQNSQSFTFKEYLMLAVGGFIQIVLKMQCFFGSFK